MGHNGEKKSSAVETFVTHLLKCSFLLFFCLLNNRVTCTQVKVAAFCGMRLYLEVALIMRTVKKKFF